MNKSHIILQPFPPFSREPPPQHALLPAPFPPLFFVFLILDLKLTGDIMRFVFTFIVDLSPPPKLSAEELMFLEPSPSKPAVSNIGSTCFFALGRETSGRFMLCNFCRFSPFNRVLDLFSVMLFLSLKVLPLFWVAIKG